MLLGLVGFAGQFPAFPARPVRRHRRRSLGSAAAARRDAGRLDAPVVRAGGADAERPHHRRARSSFSTSSRASSTRSTCRDAQSFLIAMIENKADLGNAIALNSSMVNVARLLGPSIAGVVIAATNEGWCFLIDGVSYLGVIAALIAMRIPPRPAPVDEAARRVAAVRRRVGATRSASGRFGRSSCCSRWSASSACRTRC